MTTPLDTVQAWASAERSGDAVALESLLHPEFLGIGPFGFLLDREQWMERYRSATSSPAASRSPRTRTSGGSLAPPSWSVRRSRRARTRGGPSTARSAPPSCSSTSRTGGAPAVHLSLRTPPGAAGAHGGRRRSRRGRRCVMTTGETGDRSLQDQVALVTGSSRGIGAAIATLSAEAGRARRRPRPRPRRARGGPRGIADGGGRATAVAADLTSRDGSRACARRSRRGPARSTCSSPTPAAARCGQAPSRS